MNEQVELLAYQIWEDECRRLGYIVHGRDKEHWKMAELLVSQEIAERVVSSLRPDIIPADWPRYKGQPTHTAPQIESTESPAAALPPRARRQPPPGPRWTLEERMIIRPHLWDEVPPYEELTRRLPGKSRKAIQDKIKRERAHHPRPAQGSVPPSIADARRAPDNKSGYTALGRDKEHWARAEQMLAPQAKPRGRPRSTNPKRKLPSGDQKGKLWADAEKALIWPYNHRPQSEIRDALPELRAKLLGREVTVSGISSLLKRMRAERAEVDDQESRNPRRPTLETARGEEDGQTPASAVEAGRSLATAAAGARGAPVPNTDVTKYLKPGYTPEQVPPELDPIVAAERARRTATDDRSRQLRERRLAEQIRQTTR